MADAYANAPPPPLQEGKSPSATATTAAVPPSSPCLPVDVVTLPDVPDPLDRHTLGQAQAVRTGEGGLRDE